MKYLILLFLFSVIFSYIPYGIDINTDQHELLFKGSYDEGLLSNGIINLEIYNDSTIFIGTTNELS